MTKGRKTNESRITAMEGMIEQIITETKLQRQSADGTIKGIADQFQDDMLKFKNEMKKEISNNLKPLQSTSANTQMNQNSQNLDVNVIFKSLMDQKSSMEPLLLKMIDLEQQKNERLEKRIDDLTRLMIESSNNSEKSTEFGLLDFIELMKNDSIKEIITAVGGGSDSTSEIIGAVERSLDKLMKNRVKKGKQQNLLSNIPVSSIKTVAQGEKQGASKEVMNGSSEENADKVDSDTGT